MTEINRKKADGKGACGVLKTFIAVCAMRCVSLLCAAWAFALLRLRG